MNSPNLPCREVSEGRVSDAIIKDIAVYHERIQCLTDDEANALCDEILECIEDAYKQDFISDEQVRYLTGKILYGS